MLVAAGETTGFVEAVAFVACVGLGPGSGGGWYGAVLFDNVMKLAFLRTTSPRKPRRGSEDEVIAMA